MGLPHRATETEYFGKNGCKKKVWIKACLPTRVTFNIFQRQDRYETTIKFRLI